MTDLAKTRKSKKEFKPEAKKESYDEGIESGVDFGEFIRLVVAANMRLQKEETEEPEEILTPEQAMAQEKFAKIFGESIKQKQTSTKPKKPIAFLLGSAEAPEVVPVQKRVHWTDSTEEGEQIDDKTFEYDDIDIAWHAPNRPLCRLAPLNTSGLVSLFSKSIKPSQKLWLEIKLPPKNQISGDSLVSEKLDLYSNNPREGATHPPALRAQQQTTFEQKFHPS